MHIKYIIEYKITMLKQIVIKIWSVRESNPNMFCSSWLREIYPDHTATRAVANFASLLVSILNLIRIEIVYKSIFVSNV